MASRLGFSTLALVLVLLFVNAAFAQTTWYVDDNAPGDPGSGDPLVSDPLEDGSLSHPFDAIQEAIDASSDGDEVLVADGVYTGLGNKDIDYGGRAIAVRSENGAASCVIDCEGSGRGFYLHTNEPESSVLEGFTIQNGHVYSSSPGQAYGGGILCYQSKTHILSCRLIDNVADSGGGGICVNGMPIVEDCWIEGNEAADGGGMHICWHCIVKGCTITGNEASYTGGGLYLPLGPTSIVSCTIVDNTAPQAGGCYLVNRGQRIVHSIIAGNTATAGDGGAIHVESSAYGGLFIAINCLIVNNTASGSGGAVYFLGSLPDLWPGTEICFINCTFSRNIAGPGAGAIHCFGQSGGHSIVSVYSCIFWADSSPEYTLGEWGGVSLDSRSTTFGADPHFISPAGPDGNPSTWLDNDYRLQATSPMIDGGDSRCVSSDQYDIDGDGITSERWPLDLDGLPRFVDYPEKPDTGYADPPLYPEVVDRGCYEFQCTPPSPVIELTATAFSFTAPSDGSDPADQNLGISNSGDGTLTWVVAEDCPWLEVNPTWGICTTEVDHVVISVNPEGFAEGVYETSLVVSAVSGVCEPRTVSVELRVGPALVPAEYATIQGAIDAVPSGREIVVADGVYTGPENRDLDCQGKTLWIHSLNGAANCVIDCEGAGRGFTFSSGEDAATIIEGFTIRNGYVTQDGGAVRCANSSPTIRDCVIEDCEAGDDGGGIYCFRSDPAVLGCTIANNSAGDDGGAVFCEMASDPILISCLLAGNSVSSAGGAVCSTSSDLTLTGCLVAGNTAEQGSAAFCGDGDLFVQDTTLTGNEAISDGGISCVAGGRLLMRNSILWGNSPEEIVLYSGSVSPVIIYSDVAGGWTGGGNIDANPFFLDPDGLDDDPTTWADNDYRLMAGSPCIDAGCNQVVPLDDRDLDRDGDTSERIPLDLSGFARFVDDPDTVDTGLANPPWYPAVVDMGAYEYPSVEVAPGDLNCDGTIDVADIEPFALAMLDPDAYAAAFPECDVSRADCNADTVVDGLDIESFIVSLLDD